MAKEPSKKKAKKLAKKLAKKVVKKKALKKELKNIPDHYHNPTQCDTCGYTWTVRKEGVACKRGPVVGNLDIPECPGTLQRIV